MDNTVGVHLVTMATMGMFTREQLEGIYMSSYALALGGNQQCQYVADKFELVLALDHGYNTEQINGLKNAVLMGLAEAMMGKPINDSGGG